MKNKNKVIIITKKIEYKINQQIEKEKTNQMVWVMFKKLRLISNMSRMIPASKFKRINFLNSYLVFTDKMVFPQMNENIALLYVL